MSKGPRVWKRLKIQGCKAWYRTWSRTPKGRSFTTGKRHNKEMEVEQKVETKKKTEDLPCFSNGLAEPLGLSF